MLTLSFLYLSDFSCLNEEMPRSFCILFIRTTMSTEQTGFSKVII